MNLLHPSLETTNRQALAFSMIEVIGVLSVMVILVSLLVPKVMDSVMKAKVNTTASNYATVKTALADHYARFGLLNSSNGVVFVVNSSPVWGYDNYLIAESLLERPFESKIGTGWNVLLRQLVSTSTAVDGQNAAYWLSGTGATNSNETGTGTYVIECVISNALVADAMVLNDILDGPGLNSGSATAGDTRGRVKYAAPVSGITTVFMYLAHK